MAPVGEAQEQVALHVGGGHEEVRRVGPAGAAVAVAAGRVAVGARADVLELGRGQPRQARRDCIKWRSFDIVVVAMAGLLFFPPLWHPDYKREIWRRTYQR